MTNPVTIQIWEQMAKQAEDRISDHGWALFIEGIAKFQHSAFINDAEQIIHTKVFELGPKVHLCATLMDNYIFKGPHRRR